jgi:hypothetical protein
MLAFCVAIEKLKPLQIKPLRIFDRDSVEHPKLIITQLKVERHSVLM